eukprot:3523841-Amphidinium_carterae.1
MGAWTPRVRIPGSLLSDEEASRLEVLQAADDPQSAVAQQMAARSAAREAFIRLDADSRIRRAVLRLARATPGPWSVGDFVYFRREQTKGVIKWIEGTQRVWVRFGSQTVLVTPQQLRRANGEELETHRLSSETREFHPSRLHEYLDIREDMPQTENRLNTVPEEGVPDFGGPPPAQRRRLGTDASEPSMQHRQESETEPQQEPGVSVELERHPLFASQQQRLNTPRDSASGGRSSGGAMYPPERPRPSHAPELQDGNRTRGRSRVREFNLDSNESGGHSCWSMLWLCTVIPHRRNQSE